MEKKKILLVRDSLMSVEQAEMFRFVEDYGAELKIVEDHPDFSYDELVKYQLQFETEGPDSVPQNEDILREIKDADVVISYFSAISSASVDNAEHLSAACILRSGTENIDATHAAKRGVKVINTPGRLAVCVSEYTVGLIIAEIRNIARSHADIMRGNWVNYYTNKDYSYNIEGSTVGLIGLGAVGSRVAKVLSTMGAKILVFDEYARPEAIRAEGYTPVTLEELCKWSDIISVHYRLTEKTRRMIRAEHIAIMKPTAYFINTARAGLVDEEALIAALRERRIGGAAIDVFTQEPLPQDSPYLALDNVTLTPHMAGVSSEEFRMTFAVMERTLRKYLSTGEWEHVVN